MSTEQLSPSYWRRAARRILRPWRPRTPEGFSFPGAPIVVLTDLDGSPQEHGARSNWPAKEALDALGRFRIPLVISSSGTRVEIEHLQQELNICHPFIAENGGALFVPLGYFPSVANATRGPGYQSVEFGIPYHAVVDGIRLASEEVRVPIAGFSDLSIDQIAADCQLSLPMARLAKLREYSEPFRILHSGQSAQSRLFEAAHRRKLRCFTRGRYHYVTGVVDPAASVRTLVELYREACPEVVTAAIVDGLGDLAVLREVDVPIVVHNPPLDAARLLRKVPTAHLTSASGAEGWNEAIFSLIDLRVSGSLEHSDRKEAQ
jgi:mannosyl-3-phosphoglycerate phosphatase